MNDTPDRLDDYLPARRSTVPPPAASTGQPAYDDVDTLPPPGHPRGVSFRMVTRALRRHWWQAGLAWLALSSGLVALAYYKVKPTYPAESRVKVENAGNYVFTGQSSSAPVDFVQYMETQVSNLTSPSVIHAAFLADPGLATLPLLRGSVDAEGDVRRALTVGVVPKTNLISVSMSSQDPEEAPRIVNAVVKAFLEVARETYDSSTGKKIERLEKVLKEQNAKVQARRKEIEAIHDRIGSADVERFKSRNVTSIDRARQINEQLTNVEIHAIAAKAKLDQLRNDKTLPVRPQDDDSVKQAITEEFYADPQVSALQQQRERAQAKLKDAERLSRLRNDPSLVRAEEQVRELDARINERWVRIAPAIGRRIRSSPNDDSIDHLITEAEANLAALRTEQETLQAKLDSVEIKSKDNEGELLQLEYRTRDLQRDEKIYDQIQNNLSQLKYDAESPVARIDLMYPASRANRPNGDRRVQLMAAAPLVTAMAILGLLVLMEFRGARVVDPEELSSRVNLQVIGVVPPLPQIRTVVSGGNGKGTALAAQDDIRARRQLDEFVQSLDHLRVALCARRDPWGRDRHCVLITSACGSEGKTTLAAQLAERCVNAGLMTLLIDADLRNPTLSRMLDAPDNPGLINVLRGEMTAEDVVMVIGDAGGFHLLPAGTPRMDPSRLLAGDRLGKLLAQARESFDMIIVDAPPVLPVPDALTIGRWTDGAVLAVRYDTSRFPLVERAQKRLSHVGVPVIGAVVNGVRSTEAYYGSYGYGSYGYGSFDDDADGLGDVPSPAPAPSPTPTVDD